VLIGLLFGCLGPRQGAEKCKYRRTYESGPVGSDGSSGHFVVFEPCDVGNGWTFRFYAETLTIAELSKSSNGVFVRRVRWSIDGHLEFQEFFDDTTGELERRETPPWLWRQGDQALGDMYLWANLGLGDASAGGSIGRP